MKKKKKICLTYGFNPIQLDLCELGWVGLGRVKKSPQLDPCTPLVPTTSSNVSNNSTLVYLYYNLLTHGFLFLHVHYVHLFFLIHFYL